MALCAVLLTAVLTARAGDSRSLVLVIGAPGASNYAEQFNAWADLWKGAASKGGLATTIIGRENDTNSDDRVRLLTSLSSECAKTSGELWLVFLGHGTFDGHAAKFNLRGPDISADDLAAALKGCRRPLAIIQCASASGPFLNALSAPGRVVITATRSGYEANATRFGGFLARAISDPAADLDKDGQTSLLEAFLYASRQTAQFYKDQGRLATEHALLEDNGDGLGTPADWFRGLRAVKSAANGKAVDGARAHQFVLVRGAAEEELSPQARARRDELEAKLNDLRARKTAIKEDDYYKQLEVILLDIARLYQSAK